MEENAVHERTLRTQKRLRMTIFIKQMMENELRKCEITVNKISYLPTKNPITLIYFYTMVRRIIEQRDQPCSLQFVQCLTGNFQV